MATSHDNFFITTLIDRASHQSGRMSSIIDRTLTSRHEFNATLVNTNAMPTARIYAWTGGDENVTFVLGSETLALGTKSKPYEITVKSEGGINNQTLTISTEGSETISGAATVTIGSQFAKRHLYTNGENWFVL